MEVKIFPPSVINFQEINMMISYPGQIKTCVKCGAQGYLVKDWGAQPRFRRSHNSGHIARESRFGTKCMICLQDRHGMGRCPILQAIPETLPVSTGSKANVVAFKRDQSISQSKKQKPQIKSMVPIAAARTLNKNIVKAVQKTPPLQLETKKLVSTAATGSADPAAASHKEAAEAVSAPKLSTPPASPRSAGPTKKTALAASPPTSEQTGSVRSDCSLVIEGTSVATSATGKLHSESQHRV